MKKEDAEKRNPFVFDDEEDMQDPFYIDDDEEDSIEWKAAESACMYGTPPLDLDESKQYTYADYLSWLDNVRRELLDGFIFVMSAPRTIHAQLTGWLFALSRVFVKKRKGKCQVFVAPFDVRLPKHGETADNKIDTIVQPDVCVVCDPSKIEERGCLGAPDMIAEILSKSSAKTDLTLKFRH